MLTNNIYKNIINDYLKKNWDDWRYISLNNYSISSISPCTNPNSQEFLKSLIYFHTLEIIINKIILQEA